MSLEIKIENSVTDGNFGWGSFDIAIYKNSFRSLILQVSDLNTGCGIGSIKNTSHIDDAGFDDNELNYLKDYLYNLGENVHKQLGYNKCKKGLFLATEDNSKTNKKNCLEKLGFVLLKTFNNPNEGDGEGEDHYQDLYSLEIDFYHKYNTLD